MTTRRSRPEPELLLKSECAEYLRISVRSVEQLIQSGRLAAIKWQGSVRIEKSELRAFVERNRLEIHRTGSPDLKGNGSRSRTRSRSRHDQSDVRLARDIAAEFRKGSA